MIKLLLILPLTTLFSSLALAKIEIQTNYPLAVVTAAYTWSGVGMNSMKLEEILNQKIQNQIDLKNQLRTNLEKLPQFCSGKDERNECHNSRELLVNLALESKDLNQLAKKMMGVWSLKTVTDLMTPMNEFSEHYEKEIWKETKKDFYQQIDTMKKAVEKMNADEFLNNMKAFYGSNWPTWLPNVVGVYPVPAKTGHTSGSSYGHFAEQAILLDDKGAADVLAVSFHEMAHGYYRYQNKETLTLWNNIIAKFPLKDRYILQALLNEGLATILGNGISYELMTGEQDKDPWYNDPFIEAFARANFDLVQKKFLDKSAMTEKDFQLW